MTPETDRGGRGGDGSGGVASALELLREEVEREAERIGRVGADAFLSLNRPQIDAALAHSEAVAAFRGKVAALIAEWNTLAKRVNRGADGKTGTARRNLGRLPKGVRTPEEAFFQPILRVLNEMGGRGPAGDVVERVGRIMEPDLRDVDRQPLPRDGKPRWQKSVNWARHRMIGQGLLKSDSPRGIWEISAEGRARLDRRNRSSAI